MTAAYTVLSDPATRAKYDRELIYHRFGNFYEN
jgi:curved DNA-binding protein CbpA